MVFQSLVKARDPATARSLDDPIRFMSTMFALREVSPCICALLLVSCLACRACNRLQARVPILGCLKVIHSAGGMPYGFMLVL